MSISDFWPSLQNCLDCIKPEAENPSDAVFLAVHQQMTFVRTSFATQQKETRTEKQLLNAFLRDDPSGRIIMPILGESGIGKSHLIRWLDVQLRQRTDDKNRHVIRIPKSSSLKSVLGRILDGLEGPRYQEIREQLKSAREQMDDIGARNRVRAELLSAIERKYAAASERKAKAKKSGGEISEEDKLWIGHGDSRALRAIFNDPATDKLFLEGTKDRPGIISEISRHLTKDSKEEDAPRRQFEDDDFLVPDALAESVNQNASPIANKYLQRLAGSNGKHREAAVKLLNKIVDDAIAPLATPADTSLAELFYEVRRQLLQEGRELVLLVEDFAVLAGVQGALLDAMIREGEVGGKAEACMIRTALAVTDGYFEDFDTVKTRAVHGWRIEAITSDEDESTTVDRISNFVAAYVNAARIGATKLEKHYLASKGKQYEVPHASKLIDPSERDSEVISGFGVSATGLSLFPFNRFAVSELASWKLRNTQGELRFHPRSIINEIVLPVVKNYRPDFEKGTFPPLDFLGFARNKFQADLIQEVRRMQSDAQTQWRLLYLLRFWGGNPSKTKDSKVPLQIFEAFKLSPLDPNAKVDVPDIKTKKTDKDEVVPPQDDPKSGSAEPKEIANLVERLESWREGTPESALSQGDSNKLRKLIGETIFDAINWESLLLQQIKRADCSFAWKNTLIPNAKGNQASEVDAFVIVESQESFKEENANLRIFLELRALVRFSHYRNWNYPDGEFDYARLANFIQSRVPLASQWVVERYQNVKGDVVPSIVQTLLWQSRILNVQAAQRSDDAGLVSSLFEADIPSGQRDDDWQFFLLECENTRPTLQQLLIERVVARQGTGKSVHAIDAMQIVPIVKKLKKEWLIDEAFPRVTTSISDEIQNARDYCNKLMRSGANVVKKQRKQVLAESKQVIKELGESFDKNELVKTFEEIIETAQKNGLPGEVTSGQMKKLVEAFRAARSKEVLDQIKVIEENESGGAMLSAIAMLDGQTHKLLVEFAEKGARYVKERIGAAQSKIGDWTDEVVKSKTDEVDNLLAELETIATEFSGGNS